MGAAAQCPYRLVSPFVATSPAFLRVRWQLVHVSCDGTDDDRRGEPGKSGNAVRPRWSVCQCDVGRVLGRNHSELSPIVHVGWLQDWVIGDRTRIVQLREQHPKRHIRSAALRRWSRHFQFRYSARTGQRRKLRLPSDGGGVDDRRLVISYGCHCNRGPTALRQWIASRIGGTSGSGSKRTFIIVHLDLPLGPGGSTDDMRNDSPQSRARRR